jgi:peptidoglycan/LPS O-acetylase OafA/YrhL
MTTADRAPIRIRAPGTDSAGAHPKARGRRYEHRPDIQGLRAVSVLLVILNHAGTPGFEGGYIGVDVFFVISGYVITLLLLRSAEEGRSVPDVRPDQERSPRPIPELLGEFYARRIRRIVPAATVTLAATALVSYVVLGRDLNPSLPTDIRWASLFGANFRLISGGADYFVPGAHPSLITQFWSLAVEEQFYVFFPLILFIVLRFGRLGFGPPRSPAPDGVPAARIVIGSGIVASAWWSAHISGAQPVTAYYSPFTRFWELGLGCLLATMSTAQPTRTIRSDRLAASAGAVLLALALVTLGPSSTYPGTLAWLPCLAAALLIWAGRRGPRTPITKVLSSAPLRYIGDLSYSLYLWHFVWLKLPEQLSHPWTGWAWRTVEVTGSFVTASLSYYMVENPTRRDPRLARDKAATWLLLAVCVAGVWAAAAWVGGRLG